MKSMLSCVAAVTVGLALLSWAVGDETSKSPAGPGKILSLQINKEQPHPKAYHPNLNDLVKCTWIAPVVPGSMISDLRVAIDRPGVSLAGVVDTTPPKILGVRHVSEFLIPRESVVTKVTFTPILGGGPGKPVDIRILPNPPNK